MIIIDSDSKCFTSTKPVTKISQNGMSESSITFIFPSVTETISLTSGIIFINAKSLEQLWYSVLVIELVKKLHVFFLKHLSPHFVFFQMAQSQREIEAILQVPRLRIHYKMIKRVFYSSFSQIYLNVSYNY